MGYYFQFGAGQEARASMSVEDTQRGLKKREFDELGRDYLRNKGYKVVSFCNILIHCPGLGTFRCFWCLSFVSSLQPIR